MKLCPLFILFLFLSTTISQAAGIMYRVQQMKAQRQQASQGNGPEDQTQGAPAQPTYQQTVDERNQAIAQAILNANGHSQVSDGTENTSSASSSTQAPEPSASSMALPQAGPAEVKDVVDLSEVWKKLDTKSTVWTLLIDDQAKLLTVSEYIGRFQQEGVKINEPPMHYVQMIDQLTQQNPQMLQQPFGELIQILAIIDYDFDNGMDKDALVRKVLGEAGYEANKKRFTQQQSQ
jgi:hypothetical protein